MSGGISVVICCYNSAARIPETLRHLAAQRVSGEIPWEVVIVDNASTDETAETARRCWPATSPAPLRVVSEPQSGLSHARIRGIQEARYEIISFIDDDNWAAEDWILRVEAIFASRPEIGAAGGRIEAVCEITSPDWFAPLQGHYAVGQQHSRTGDITESTGTLLCGAGLNLRTRAARKLLEDGFVFMMSGRKGNSLLTGEDTEFCFALRASGWRFWYDDDLVLQHFIPKGRLQWDYVRRLKRGMGESSTLFDLYLCALSAPPFVTYPMWKRSWLFQTLKAHWLLARLVMSHSEVLFGQPEGSLTALDFEELKSRVVAMWSLCGRYKKMQKRLRSAPWARKSGPVDGVAA